VKDKQVVAVKYKDCAWVKVWNMTTRDARETEQIVAYMVEGNKRIYKRRKL
jgi:hypothetical protein